MNGFLAALQFLTVVPVNIEFTGDDIGRSMPKFPLVGLLIGLTAAALYGIVGVGAVQAVLMVIFLGGISGGLHLDGMADTADGLLSSRPRERMLEIMRDSRIGTMGVLALMAVFGLKVAALVSVEPAVAWRAVFLAPVAGRCALVIAMHILPYARPEGGLAAIFMEHRQTKHVVWAVIVIGIVSLLLFAFKGLIIASACAATIWGFSAYVKSKIGGMTGDTLGATCELTEAVVFLIVSFLY